MSRRRTRAAPTAPPSAPPGPPGRIFRSRIIPGADLEDVVNAWCADGFDDVNWEWVPWGEDGEVWQSAGLARLHVWAWRSD